MTTLFPQTLVDLSLLALRPRRACPTHGPHPKFGPDLMGILPIGIDLATSAEPRDAETLPLPSPSPVQRQAIQAAPEPLLVLAGPGAGKTFCLT
jgi:hypothetical protein